MTNDELCLLPLERLAGEIASKRVSPVEATEAVLARIERLNPKLNAYLTVTAERAVDEARRAEREIQSGDYRGALHGVPLAYKDLLATKGVRTTAGSRILDAWVPDYDATPIAKLHDVGAVMLGKLGMHEWAFGTTSDNAHYGSVCNPWDPACVPGGSSGGSGVATAAGMAFATLGSDTGGSIRIPASECGCVGLMPTFGRVSNFGAVPLAWSLDHVGPLTRTVRDAAIMLQAIAGYDARDPESIDAPGPDFLDGIERGPHGLRIGVPKQHFWEKIDAEVATIVRESIEKLREAGADVREVDFPQAQVYAAIPGAVLLTEALAYHQQYYPARKDDYSRAVTVLLEGAQQISATQYAQAMRMLRAARAGEADAVLDGVDVLAVPTMPAPPPTIESTRSGVDEVKRTSLTGPFDLTGQPVISVPAALTTGRLPVGISFVARRWDERSALRAGRAWELVRGEFPSPQV